MLRNNVEVRESLGALGLVELHNRLVQKCSAIRFQILVRIMKAHESVDEDQILDQLVECWLDVLLIQLLLCCDFVRLLVCDNCRLRSSMEVQLGSAASSPSNSLSLLALW